MKRILPLTIVLFSIHIYADDKIAVPDGVKPSEFYDKEGNLFCPDSPNDVNIGWQKVSNEHHENDRLKSIVGLRTEDGKPACSATIIKPPNCSDPSKAKVQVITAGHCTGGMARGGRAITNLFEKSPDARNQMAIESVKYSTENGADIGVLELDSTHTYKDLARLGIVPSEISGKCDPTEDLESIAIPLNQLAGKDQVIRRSTCRQGARTTIIDQWRYWPNVMTLNACTVIGGSSGSSFYDKSGKMCGIMNASTYCHPDEKGVHECQKDTCVFEGGMPKRVRENFATDITVLNKCYKDCVFDADLPDCPLPSNNREFGRRGGQYRWNLEDKITFGTSEKGPKFKSFEVKGCKQDQTPCDCRDPKGYTNVAGSTSGGHTVLKVAPKDFLPGLASYKAKEGDATQFHRLCFRGRIDDGTPLGKLDDIKNAWTEPIFFEPQHKPPFLK